MKKFPVWIVSILVISFIVILLTMKHSPFGKKNTSFASNPKNSITRIVFMHGKEELTLENKDGKWILNDRLQTRKSSISYILNVLTEMTIKSPVSPELFDTVIASKNILPVRVRTFEDRNLLSDFLVYKTQSNIYGNIMKTGERAKPFIVYVPGHDSDIGSVFNMNELYWQPYTIFNLLPSEIASVDLINNNDSTNNFRITRTGKAYSLSDGHNTLSGWDSTLVKRYFSYFTFIPFESWASDMSVHEKARIISSRPAFHISVKTAEGAIQNLSLWTRTKSDGSADSDRLYGKTDASDELFIVRYYDIDPVLKKREYFFN